MISERVPAGRSMLVLKVGCLVAMGVSFHLKNCFLLYTLYLYGHLGCEVGRPGSGVAGYERMRQVFAFHRLAVRAACPLGPRRQIGRTSCRPNAAQFSAYPAARVAPGRSSRSL